MTYYVVINNIDRTESRRGTYAYAICELFTTAERIAKDIYPQGIMDCAICETDTVVINGKEYFEKSDVPIIIPTLEDKQKESDRLLKKIKMLQKQELFEKMKNLGITDEEIELIKNG